jgi:hypothetical protein
MGKKTLKKIKLNFGGLLMKDLIKAMDNLDWVIKLILCIPVLDIVWNVYRLLRSIDASNVLGIILSIVLIIGAPIVWLVDLICVIVNKKVWWFC